MKPGHGGRGQGKSEREEGSTPSATAQLRMVGYVFFVELFLNRGGPEETGWREKGIHPGSGPGLLQTAVMRYDDNLN